MEVKTLNETRCSDNNNWIHPWENLNTLGHADRIIIQKAKGIYLYDENNQKLIDGPGGMWCVQIGYGHPEMAKATAHQIKNLNYMSPFFATSEPSAQAAKRLAELTPSDLNEVFFTTGGSTAIDTALRLVQFYNNTRGLHYKKHIIAQGNSYHGATHLSSQVSSKDDIEDVYDTDTNLVHFLPTLVRKPEQLQMNESEFCRVKVDEFKALIIDIGPQNIAAFIAEPIQAAGGVIIPPKYYLKSCHELCKLHDILYISDEVVTGFGRLGHWFASKNIFDVEPDMITCAKGLSSGYIPIGAVMISARLFQEIRAVKARNSILSQGFTYSGHPVCCAAVLKNLEIIEKSNLLEHVRTLEPYFQQQFLTLRDLPGVINIRGMGFLACIECELREEDAVNIYPNILLKLHQECRKNGLMIRFLHQNIVFSPLLIITKKEIDKMIKILRAAFIAIMPPYIRSHHVA